MNIECVISDLWSVLLIAPFLDICLPNLVYLSGLPSTALQVVLCVDPDPLSSSVKIVHFSQDFKGLKIVIILGFHILRSTQ